MARRSNRNPNWLAAHCCRSRVKGWVRIDTLTDFYDLLIVLEAQHTLLYHRATQPPPMALNLLLRQYERLFCLARVVSLNNPHQ